MPFARGAVKALRPRYYGFRSRLPWLVAFFRYLNEADYILRLKPLQYLEHQPVSFFLLAPQSRLVNHSVITIVLIIVVVPVV
jgi:hypothetical protein